MHINQHQYKIQNGNMPNYCKFALYLTDLKIKMDIQLTVVYSQGQDLSQHTCEVEGKSLTLCWYLYLFCLYRLKCCPH